MTNHVRKTTTRIPVLKTQCNAMLHKEARDYPQRSLKDTKATKGKQVTTRPTTSVAPRTQETQPRNLKAGYK